MHRKLALMLTMLALLVAMTSAAGSLSQAPAALAVTGPTGSVAHIAAGEPGVPAQPAAPAAPSGLEAAPAGPSSVLLTWTNNATIPAATAIEIQRATDPAFTTNVASFETSPTSTTFVDISVVAGMTFYYRVLAQGLAGLSSWSNAVWIQRPGPSAPVSFFGPQFACASYCDGSFGWDRNAAVTTADNVPATTSFTKVLRVLYPQGSIDSGAVTTLGAPLGGAQAALPFSTGPTSAVTTLRYYLRPQPGFQSVKGGKLPGLYGGETTVASGGHDPNGTNGWSSRLMWRNDNNGEVYAYLDGTKGYGLQLGCGNWTWQPGKWTKVQETVRLNTPGQANGSILIYINGVPALDAVGLTFRTARSLQINGLFFSTFFGGHDKTWATPATQYMDFAGFGVSNQPLSAPPAAACTVLLSGHHTGQVPGYLTASGR